jgi:hypothetical protein
MTARGPVDWEKVRLTLEQIQSKNPGFLEENTLIGGAAAHFYLQKLGVSGDEDFMPPSYSHEEELSLLSKDIDFIGTLEAELASSLECCGATTDHEGHCRLAGIWIDSPDQGVTFTRDGADSSKLKAKLEGLEFYVASPSVLLKEKRSLIRMSKKERPQDPLHVPILERACKLELIHLFDPKTFKAWFVLATHIKENNDHVLADTALQKRLRALAETLPDTEPNVKRMKAWIEHMLPKVNRVEPEIT